MTEQDLNEVAIILDQLTLLRLKMQQLEQNKPRPANYYNLEEELMGNFDNTKDLLVETLISKNMASVMDRTGKKITT